MIIFLQDHHRSVVPLVPRQMDHSVEKVLSEQLLKIAAITEEEVDCEIKKYDNLDENDLEAIRQKRLQELKKKQLQRRASFQITTNIFFLSIYYCS